MSLDSAVIADTLMPGASASSYIVMTGPVSISTTWASMSNSLQRLLEDGRLLADELLLALGVAVLGIVQASPRRAGGTRPVPSGCGGGAICRGFSMLGSLTMMSLRISGGFGGGRLLASGRRDRRAPPTAARVRARRQGSESSMNAASAAAAAGSSCWYDRSISSTSSTFTSGGTGTSTRRDWLLPLQQHRRLRAVRHPHPISRCVPPSPRLRTSAFTASRQEPSTSASRVTNFGSDGSFGSIGNLKFDRLASPARCSAPCWIVAMHHARRAQHQIVRRQQQADQHRGQQDQPRAQTVLKCDLQKVDALIPSDPP